MLDEPAAGIGVGWREASSTPGLVGLRHGDGDVLASPPAQVMRKVLSLFAQA